MTVSLTASRAVVALVRLHVVTMRSMVPYRPTTKEIIQPCQLSLHLNSLVGPLTSFNLLQSPFNLFLDSCTCAHHNQG